MSNHDELGTRMKNQYEFRARHLLPRRTYTILRLDGKAFHTYTRGLDRPFDAALADDMAATAVALCEQVEGCRFAYQQSDEISLLLTDFTGTQTEAWFDGNVQKIVSVAASLATAHFNQARDARDLADYQGALGTRACFDARVFTIPDPVEVANYFIWRQQDCTRNSVSMAAQARFSPRQLHGKSGAEKQEMLHEVGVNWNDYPVHFKRGAAVDHVTVAGPVDYYDGRIGGNVHLPAVTRHVWGVVDPPIFTQHPWLTDRIPGLTSAMTVVP